VGVARRSLSATVGTFVARRSLIATVGTFVARRSLIATTVRTFVARPYVV
jgi:hypothetical protein